ncbi:hypothetical protein BZARG_3112 [Bizionia argentinensis JUB59]|uniref:Uncharacterized protein n=1 Tax=Bizionia argentinensis JUB59 TaxID=1046627 RepID=G2EGK5_9FLAO|nr:hypothetical protein [Bizionia argentinensis]EGV42431.1 hypothetical protein BZARG_3112 [Bizionia argentinensis JUB59]
MVVNQSLNPEDNIDLVERYFEENFKEYVLIKKTNYTGYWWVEYVNGIDVKICFDGDTGGHFSVKIFIDNTEYFLWQFDRSVNSRTQSTSENILYQLKVLKIFIK